VPAVARGRPRRFCSEGCSREWYAADKRLAREVASLQLELDELDRKAGATPPPKWAQKWHREEFERTMVRTRERIASLEYELEKALAARREHGWQGTS
jgi:hypothetical protein